MALSHQFIVCANCGNMFSVDSQIKNPPNVCPDCKKIIKNGRSKGMGKRSDLKDKICRLECEVTQLEADLRGKDNEIVDLKARIKHLEQYKIAEKDEPTTRG